MPAIQLKPTARTIPLGFAGPLNVTGIEDNEHAPQLVGQAGAKIFHEMVRSSSACKQLEDVVARPLLSTARWIQPASDAPQDLQVAEFVAAQLGLGVLTEEGDQPNPPNGTFSAFLNTSFRWMLRYGHADFEVVLARQGGQFVLKSLAERHPVTILRYLYDDEGQPTAAIQQGTSKRDAGADSFIPTNVFTAYLRIPAERLLIFTGGREGSDLQGTSLFRSVYQDWFWGQKVKRALGLGIDQHLFGVWNYQETEQNLTSLNTVTATDYPRTDTSSGLPVITSASKATAAQRAVTLISGGGATWTPFGVALERIAGEGAAITQALEVVRYYDRRILEGGLAGWMNLGQEGAGGSYNLGQIQWQNFMDNENALLNVHDDLLNARLIPLLVEPNFEVAVAPRYVSAPITSTDAQAQLRLWELAVQIGAVSTSELRAELGLSPEPDGADQGPNDVAEAMLARLGRGGADGPA